MRPRASRKGRSPSDAQSFLDEGRLVVAYVDGAYVGAICRTDDAVLNLGFDVERGWWCSCEQPGCAHVEALKLVTEPAVTVFRTGSPTPAGAERASSARRELGERLSTPVPAGREVEPEPDAVEPEAPVVPVAEVEPPPGWTGATDTDQLPVEPFFEDDAAWSGATAGFDATTQPTVEDAGETPAHVDVAVAGEPAAPPDQEPATGEGSGGTLGTTFSAKGTRRWGSRSFVILLLVAAAIAVTIWTAHPFDGRSSAASRPPSSPRSSAPTTTLTPTPTATPSAQPSSPPPAASVVSVRFPNQVSAAGLALSVNRLPSHDSDCLTHLFARKAAYQSNCRSWTRVHGGEWFWVVFRNRSSGAVAFRAGAFWLQGRHHVVAHPVDVRRMAGDPRDFLPMTASVPAGSTLAGWLVFTPRHVWTPTSLVYHATPRLAIRFRGPVSVHGRS